MNAPVRSGSALLAVRGVVKRFGGVQALQGVDFDLQPGEIHALLGENGAGKSTLMNILSGVIEPDAREVRIDGEAVRFADPRAAQAAGVATIFRETRRAAPPSAAIPSYRPSTINRLFLRNNNKITLKVMAIVPLRDYGRGSKQAPGPNQKRTMSVEPSAPRARNTTRRKLNDC
jgi:ABC-type glutathione transport system ATPase component